MKDRRADDIINQILDDQGSGESCQELLARLRQDARACEALARTRIGVERLREPVETPDLTDDILGRVHARRRFLPARSRRLVTAGRVAIAAGVVGAVGLASFVQRHAPEMRPGAGAAPVGRIVEATGQTAPRQAGLDRAVASIEASLAAPVRGLSLEPSMRPEQRFHYDLSVARTAVVTEPMRPIDGALGRVADMGGSKRSVVLGAPVHLEPQTADSTLISRFQPLLVILRSPPATGEQVLRELETQFEVEDE